MPRRMPSVLYYCRHLGSMDSTQCGNYIIVIIWALWIPHNVEIILLSSSGPCGFHTVWKLYYCHLAPLSTTPPGVKFWLLGVGLEPGVNPVTSLQTRDTSLLLTLLGGWNRTKLWARLEVVNLNTCCELRHPARPFHNPTPQLNHLRPRSRVSQTFPHKSWVEHPGPVWKLSHHPVIIVGKSTTDIIDRCTVSQGFPWQSISWAMCKSVQLFIPDITSHSHIDIKV